MGTRQIKLIKTQGKYLLPGKKTRENSGEQGKLNQSKLKVSTCCQQKSQENSWEQSKINQSKSRQVLVASKKRGGTRQLFLQLVSQQKFKSKSALNSGEKRST